jgi:hypothetical protein
MGLLDKLKSGNSTLGLNGEKPTPNQVAGGITPNAFLEGSNLDLNGTTPETYADTAPEGQGGKV